jgi:hypothetical protein
MTAAPFAFEERPSQHSQWYPDGVGMQSEKAGVSLCPQSSPAAPRSPARQFKEATGLPPHQYVIARRVERARELLQARTDVSLAEIGLRGRRIVEWFLPGLTGERACHGPKLPLPLRSPPQG